jgi:hypothetical protein
MQLENRSRMLGIVVAIGLGLPLVLMATTEQDESRTACLTEAQKALVGQELDAAQDVLPETARIIPPDSAITQDHNPERVNVDVDEDGVILRVWCG